MNKLYNPTTLLLAAVTALALSGCMVTDRVVTVVDYYCGKPQVEREALRAVVDAQLLAKGHSVKITCRGDG